MSQVMSLPEILAISQELEVDLGWIYHYLPHQGPLQFFVHHNTLGSLEDYDFEMACQIAKNLYGGECFLEQKYYLNYLAAGQISQFALQNQLRTHFLPEYTLSSAQLDSLMTLLNQPPHLSLQDIIAKHLENSQQHQAIHEIRQMIASCKPSYGQNEAHDLTHALGMPTYRDLIFAEKEIDIDDLIKPLMAKFLSAYADPGCAYWKMEYRSQGLWACFLEHYQSDIFLENDFGLLIQKELCSLSHQNLSLDQTLIYYCLQLQLKPDMIKHYLLSMALRLRGWASLFGHLEHHPEHRLDQTDFSLKEFLVVKLLFEYLCCQKYIKTFDSRRLLDYQEKHHKRQHEQEQAEWLYLALHFFEINHYLDPQGNWTISHAEQVTYVSCLKQLLKEKRLYLYQKALESTYAYHCLSAVKQANQTPLIPPEPLDFHYITCIDDREESLRRYIEQSHPACLTYGIAGHFGLNMNFQSFNDLRARKLCPGNLEADFEIQQVQTTAVQAQLSKNYARISRSYTTHSQISFVSYFLTLITGFFSVLPFFIKVFFPHLDLVLRRKLEHIMGLKPDLQDLIFTEQGNHQGLTYQAAAKIIYDSLQSIGLMSDFSSLIYIVGHGSSSINNPHEYAYNCGACGGGTGRANARIFAQIANHAKVREQLHSEYALKIPDTTYFVAGYHDTCQDHIEWFDSGFDSRLSESTHVCHERNKEKINSALKLNAFERAKKFFNVATSQNQLDKVFSDVSKRFNDLTEARPEYNHAGNALCIVGRREISRRLFLDRRAFLCSYDPEHDDGQGLAGILSAVMTVCAGINLEYYFSTVDNETYGAGSKLNHNITCHYAVMSGFASDLRLGLSKQMVEIHDPRRILFVVESKPDILLSIFDSHPAIARLVQNHWVHLVVFDSQTQVFYGFQDQKFNQIKLPPCEIAHYSRSEQIPEPVMFAVLEEQDATNT